MGFKKKGKKKVVVKRKAAVKPAGPDYNPALAEIEKRFIKLNEGVSQLKQALPTMSVKLVTVLGYIGARQALLDPLQAEHGELVGHSQRLRDVIDVLTGETTMKTVGLAAATYALKPLVAAAPGNIAPEGLTPGTITRVNTADSEPGGEVPSEP